MRTLFYFLIATVGAAGIADPYYPDTTIKGHYANGFDGYIPFVLESGVISACVPAPGPLTTTNCALSKSSVVLYVNGKKFVVAFQRVAISYIGGTPTAPDRVAYALQGPYQAVLPDGRTHEAPSTLLLFRVMANPDPLDGLLMIPFLGANGGVVGFWPKP